MFAEMLSSAVAQPSAIAAERVLEALAGRGWERPRCSTPRATFRGVLAVKHNYELCDIEAERFFISYLPERRFAVSALQDSLCFLTRAAEVRAPMATRSREKPALPGISHGRSPRASSHARKSSSSGANDPREGTPPSRDAAQARTRSSAAASHSGAGGRGAPHWRRVSSSRSFIGRDYPTAGGSRSSAGLARLRQRGGGPAPLGRREARAGEAVARLAERIERGGGGVLRSGERGGWRGGVHAV